MFVRSRVCIGSWLRGLCALVACACHAHSLCVVLTLTITVSLSICRSSTHKPKTTHKNNTGEIGTRNSRNFAAAFRLPRAGGSQWTPEVRLAQVINNQQLYCSWQEAFRGVTLGVTR